MRQRAGLLWACRQRGWHPEPPGPAESKEPTLKPVVARMGLDLEASCF